MRVGTLVRRKKGRYGGLFPDLGIVIKKYADGDGFASDDSYLCLYEYDADGNMIGEPIIRLVIYWLSTGHQILYAEGSKYWDKLEVLCK